MTNLKDLAVLLCKYEGKKKQIDVAQMCEIIKALKEAIKVDPVNIIKFLLK